MTYESAEALVKENKQEQAEVIHLAEVTSLDDKGRAKVKFFGEDTESGKTYTYIDGYVPKVGDKVLMLSQGNTFIIMGKVTVETVVVRYALKDHNHDETYAPKEHPHASLTNEKKTLEVTTDGEIVPGEDAKYYLGTAGVAFAEGHINNVVASYITMGDTKFDKTDLISKIIDSSDEKCYVILTSSNLAPYSDQAINLGTASKMFNNLYAKTIYANGKQISPYKIISTTVSGRELELMGNVLTPNADDTVEIGSSSKRFLKVYGKTFYGDAMYLGDYEISPSIIYSNSRTEQYVKMEDNTLTPSHDELINLGSSTKQFSKAYIMQLYLDGQRIYPYRMVSDAYPTSRYIDFNGDSLKPNSNGAYNIGTSNYQYKAVYAQNVYVNGTAVSTSDKRKKKYIKKLQEKYVELFKKLRPVTFKYKNGTSGRTHAGFIAQEVEQAMQECGISNEEFGGLVIQDNGEYGLRYEEFIALQTAVIQDLQKRVEKLERRNNNGK